MKKPIYLDYAATTPTDLRVFEAMRPFFTEIFGNAGSRTHAHGQEAKQAVEFARVQIASLINARSEEVVFTSGATEANNLVLLGLIAHGIEHGRRHVLATAVEHKSVLEPLAQMKQAGFEVELLAVSEGGYVDPINVKRKIRSDTLLLSIMHANNETGVLQPISDIGKLLEGTEVLFHVDAAQTFGKRVDEIRAVPWDFLSISGHKIFAPKGIGALCVRRKSNRRRILRPIMFGGGQEIGLRPGTLAVPLIVALGAASAIAAKEFREWEKQALKIKTELLNGLIAVEHSANGNQNLTLSNVLNVSFTGVESEALMMALRNEVSISNGAACTSTSYSTSHVLSEMGLSSERISSAVRISWGPGVKLIPVEAIIDTVKNLRLF